MHGKPTNLIVLIRIYASAHRACDQLSPKTDTKDCVPGPDGAPDKFLLLNEPGQDSLVVDAHGATHDNE